MNMNHQNGQEAGTNNKMSIHNMSDDTRDISVSAQQQLMDIADHIEVMLNDESQTVDEDIHRIGHLIHDAMELLQHSFNKVVLHSHQQTSLIQDLKKNLNGSSNNHLVGSSDKPQKHNVDNELIQPLLENLEASAHVIQQEVNTAIRALQFEDITRQLTEHIQKRLAHINEVAVTAHTGVSEISTTEGLKALANKLYHMRQEFRQMNISDIVKQDDMSEGDIELF